MVFLLIGLLLLGLKVFGVMPVSSWPWWGLAIPFGLAVAWWSFSDALGLTQRAAARRIEARKASRRAQAMAELHPGSLKGQDRPGSQSKSRPPRKLP